MFERNAFIHHVYFWLVNPQSAGDCDELIEGLNKLSVVATIKNFHIGLPAGTSRDVIDSSYNVSWLLVFENKEAQDSYQADPVHLNFVAECKHLWNRVVVYDSMGM